MMRAREHVVLVAPFDDHGDPFAEDAAGFSVAVDHGHGGAVVAHRESQRHTGFDGPGVDGALEANALAVAASLGDADLIGVAELERGAGERLEPAQRPLRPSRRPG
jgi:hypothetical protein